MTLGKCWAEKCIGMVNEYGLDKPFNNFRTLSRYGKNDLFVLLNCF